MPQAVSACYFMAQKTAPKSRREEKSSTAPKKEPLSTLRFIGNSRDLILPFWVAIVLAVVVLPLSERI